MIKKMLLTAGDKENKEGLYHVKLTMLLASVGMGLSICYTLVYFFLTEATYAVVFNTAITAFYSLTFVLITKRYYFLAKVWFIGVLTLQLFFLATVFFTKDTGFHLYFLSIPSITYLLFSRNEKKVKFVITLISIALTYICQYVAFPGFSIVLPGYLLHISYLSTIIVVVLGQSWLLKVFADDLISAEEKQKKMAITDHLTGLYNRRHLFVLAEHCIKGSIQDNKDFSIVLIDVDYFKKINDAYGHIVGDEVLKMVARSLSQNLRDFDVAARYGGEEFILILPHTSVREAEEIAENLRRSIESLPLLVNNRIISLTISLGVAALPYGEEITIDSLIERADTAMYTAKERGRNQVVVWDEIIALGNCDSYNNTQKI
ncbi:MAG: GGDEF domain-containing protein [Clostridia bacterium]|nr:GGDEF domain-containing protein [Clostridia bacterium]